MNGMSKWRADRDAPWPPTDSPARRRRPEVIYGFRLIAEIVRRKGLSIADAQRMPQTPDGVWYMALTWDQQEEDRYGQWFRANMERTMGLSARQSEREWLLWSISFGLHRRDECRRVEHRHDAASEADLPPRRWLSVRRALVTLPGNRWNR